MRHMSFILLTFTFVLFQNCTPFTTMQSSEVGTQEPAVFSLTCSSSDSRQPSASQLKTLNVFELENTLLDLFDPHLTATQRTQFRNLLKPLVAEIPKYKDEVGMDVANHDVTSIHAERHLVLAESVSDYIAGNTSILNNILGACSSTPSTTACRRSFIQGFGARVLRRPLENESVDFYLQVMSGHPDSYRNVIAAMLSSPLFYFHSEFGGAGDSVVVKLNNYERANRLSYFLLQSMPDEELFSAAADGSISTSEGLINQVNRLLLAPKVRERLTKVFANQWLHLDHLVDPQTEVKRMVTMMTELSNPPPFNSIRNELIQEVYDFFDFMIWEQKANFKQLMTSDLVFPRTTNLAKIYGTSRWNGQMGLESLVRAPAGERSGPMTLANFLYNSSGATRPIMRGVRMYREFMCQDLDLPPDNSTPEGVEFNAEMTDREVVIANTEVPGTSCVACHKTIINPLGFAFDNFDGLGRFRMKERVFHPEGTAQAGSVLISKDVQPTQSLIIRNYIEGNVNGAVGLAHKLADNPDALACFSSKLYNFANKANLRVEENPCAVRSIFESIGRQDGTIIDGIRTIILQPEFMTRVVQ